MGGGDARMRRVHVPGLGYIHNALADFAKRLKDDGFWEIAAEYELQAVVAQEVYSHIAELGRYTHNGAMTYDSRGVELANKLMEMGWAPPEFIPTLEESEMPW